MKLSTPIPTRKLNDLKGSYDSLMDDDNPVDFKKITAILTAVGEVVRAYELKLANGKPRKIIVGMRTE